MFTRDIFRMRAPLSRDQPKCRYYGRMSPGDGLPTVKGAPRKLMSLSQHDLELVQRVLKNSPNSKLGTPNSNEEIQIIQNTSNLQVSSV